MTAPASAVPSPAITVEVGAASLVVRLTNCVREETVPEMPVPEPDPDVVPDPEPELDPAPAPELDPAPAPELDPAPTPEPPVEPSTVLTDVIR